MDFDFERDAKRLLDNPELSALIDQILAQPKLGTTPEEIEAWAKRLAEDVGNLTD